MIPYTFKCISLLITARELVQDDGQLTLTVLTYTLYIPYDCDMEL